MSTRRLPNRHPWFPSRNRYSLEKPPIWRPPRWLTRPRTLTKERGTRTHCPLRRCPHGAWSCRKQDRGRFTPRPLWLTFRLLLPAPPLEEFSEADRSSTAAGQVAALAAIHSAPQAARQEQASTLADRAPSTPHALLRAVTPAQARRGPQVLVPPLARAQVLVLLAPAARLVLEALHQPERRRAHSAPHPVDEAVARSIRKPRKAR